MPFYQETEIKDSSQIDDEQTGGSKLKILDDLEPNESDSELFDDLQTKQNKKNKRIFAMSRDDLLIYQVDPKIQKKHGRANPMNAIMAK